MRRSLLVIGRVGTVLVAIGLALLLVSLIPPVQLYSFAGGYPVDPETFRLLGSTPFGDSLDNASIPAQPFSTLSPQQELKVKLTCNDIISVYLLKTSLETLRASLTNSSVTLLNVFLEANPDVIGWQGEMCEGNVDYVPTEIINATLLFSNPSSSSIYVEYDGGIWSLLAPASKVQTLALGAIPIGFLLALPWLFELWKSRSPQTRKV